MSISDFADYLQIIAFVISIYHMVVASVSLKLRAWIKSIIFECLLEFYLT